ncbi:MarR family winged helix-turn-helix transcriptional regulator [Sphingopyxis sp. JAI128]|uniref:MarR family winged helix-turn-helix transcriptional regulator n=1 Tax=Sphingopyxis sp. JAI128 TaxID=2723066 RepID=UPI001621265B|nr:MarR family winged helix-turn-helix transcriptional regulator [Sphingopyxis sp. JAI128]MBB6427330.1 DNA-binding MarR family transcriptional regulator [Sphingopyxis sp. JAI128]
MTDMHPLDGERIAQLCRAIYDNLREQIYAAAAQEGFVDLRPSHSNVLRHLDPAGSRIVDLAVRADMTKQSMAYLTDALAKLDYVEIRPDPTDGRAKLVVLTPRGHDAVATLTRLSLEAEARIATRLGKAKLDAVRDGLAEIRGVLEKPGQ